MEITLTPVSHGEYPDLTRLWEASVRATHDFIDPKDIDYYRPLILNQYLPALQLTAARDNENRILGFLAADGTHIEMLFIHPDARGKGIGKTLIRHALEELKCTTVDVNEQNGQAVGFYLHQGFRATGRSETDPSGKPYPILHLSR